MSANRSNIAWHLENQIPREDQRAIGMVYEKIVELTSAEILALFTTAKELVEAPGVGKVLEFVSGVFFIDIRCGTTGEKMVNFRISDFTMSLNQFFNECLGLTTAGTNKYTRSGSDF